MRLRASFVCLVMAAAGAACSTSPTAPAGAASVTTPGPVSPANGVVIPNASQPVTLTVNNGLVTTDAAVNYTFEVATDAAFTTILVSKDATQSSGQTSAKLDTLPAGKDYYWHVRTKGGDTIGVFTTPMKFTIGAAVALSTPVPVQPLTGATTDAKPTLTVTNSTRSGPAGTTSYRFEIATSNTFASIAASGTVAEGSGTTSFTPSQLTGNVTLFWRAQAVDAANSATSAFSTTQSFSTVSIDLKTVNYQRFVNIADWPITNQIIAVDQDGGDGHMCINHQMRGLWPLAFLEGDPNQAVEGTQWYFARINGQWYGGAGESLRPGQICKAGQKSEDIGPDGTWGGPMDTWQPKRGDLVGYIVSTPARYWPAYRTLDERTNLVIQPWMVNGISTP